MMSLDGILLLSLARALSFLAVGEMAEGGEVTVFGGDVEGPFPLLLRFALFFLFYT